MRLFIFMPVTFAQSRVSPTVIRVPFERMLEDFDGTVDVLRLVVVLEISSPTKIEVVSGGFVGALFHPIVLPRRHPQSPGHARSQLVFNRQMIRTVDGNRVPAYRSSR